MQGSEVVDAIQYIRYSHGSIVGSPFEGEAGR